MDHIAGFDNFFRCNYDRSNKENHIWGPPETSVIMQHRFRGFLWNLNENMKATWFVNEFDGKTVKTYRFELNESFSNRHFVKEIKTDKIILNSKDFFIEAYIMNHKTPCLAYIIREKEKMNIKIDKLKELGLSPGPWLNELKNFNIDGNNKIEINNKIYALKELRNDLLNISKGGSLAYFTDFLLNDEEISELSNRMSSIDVIVCEGQYRHSDLELAQKNYHMTTVYSARLAKKLNAKQMVLFHLSDRYTCDEWTEMMNESKNIFLNTYFPENWELH